MATSVTISPSLGHAPIGTQAGVGASPGYDAIDLRRVAEAAGADQEGVFEALGWKVTQRAAGANMTVDVAATTGLAVVTGDSVTAQSRYVIPPHSAVANLDIGANATGNPRIDQVILQVRDHTHDASGQNDARVLVLAGTATSGATLDNPTGAASLPVSAIRLATILVANGAASITNAVIRDRRPWARGAYTRILRTTDAGGGSDYQTNLATFADIDSTNLKPRIECSGVPVRLTFRARVANADQTSYALFVPWVDGAVPSDISSANDMWPVYSSASGQMDMAMAFTWDIVPSAGSHQFSVAYRSSLVSTNTTVVVSTARPVMLTVEEIARQNASNS